jgi:hypothetical protein
METETTTYAERLAAFDEAQAKLAATTTVDLLSAAYQLTHRMESLQSTLDRGVLNAAERKPLRTRQAELRQQRDMITAEVLRRADGTALSVVRS